MKAKGVRYYCASCRQREAGFLRGTQVVTRTNTQEHQFLLPDTHYRFNLSPIVRPPKAFVIQACCDDSGEF